MQGGRVDAANGQHNPRVIGSQIFPSGSVPKPSALSRIKTLAINAFAYEVIVLDAQECREHARRYGMMADKTDDLRLKQVFSETAAGWLRLAADMADLNERMAKLRSAEKKDVA